MNQNNIPQYAIDQIKDAADIIEILEREGIQFKHRGSSFQAKCPFHNDTNPSFSVGKFTKKYHCFGCHKSGDIFQFFMEKYNWSFPTAVRHVAGLVHLSHLIPYIKETE